MGAMYVLNNVLVDLSPNAVYFSVVLLACLKILSLSLDGNRKPGLRDVLGDTCTIR